MEWASWLLVRTFLGMYPNVHQNTHLKGIYTLAWNFWAIWYAYLQHYQTIAQVPRVVALTYIPTCCKRVPFFYTFTNTWYCQAFIFCQTNGYIVLSCYSFNLHYPYLFNEIEHLFIFIGHLDFFFCKMSFQAFCPLRKTGSSAFFSLIYSSSYNLVLYPLYML